MIRAYTTNDKHAETISAAAISKDFQVECRTELDNFELEENLEHISILIFDLTAAAISTDTVMRMLDTFDSELLPPVLYLLASPADIEVIAQAGSIVNQDYSFIPVETASLAARLEVLNMLGARRKLTMETAITDRLTGLCNRKYFLRRLEEELYRAARYKYNVGIVLVDIDFSAKQEKLTEKSGNVVITEVADFFRERLRKTDIISRYKWDDFALLLPDIPAEDSLAVAKDIKIKLEAIELEADGVPVELSVSVGHLSFPVEEISTAVDVISKLEDCCLQGRSDETGFSAF